MTNSTNTLLQAIAASSLSEAQARLLSQAHTINKRLNAFTESELQELEDLLVELHKRDAEFHRGYAEGFEEGVAAGEINSCDAIYEQGHQEGYDEGYAAGIAYAAKATEDV